MTIRVALLGIWLLFWLAALGCWLRSRRLHDWRLSRETWLFLALGVPFLVAGGFFTKSSYPQEVWVATPAPVAAASRSTPAPSPTPLSYVDAVNAAQREAVVRYPEFGKAGTGFNSRYVARYRQLRSGEPRYFLDPQWPIQLADEVAKTMPVDH